MHLPKAELVEAKAHETLSYLVFPSNHRRQIKTDDPLQRIIREIGRRTRVVGVFPDGFRR
jgi:putative transposase